MGAGISEIKSRQSLNDFVLDIKSWTEDKEFKNKVRKAIKQYLICKIESLDAELDLVDVFNGQDLDKIFDDMQKYWENRIEQKFTESLGDREINDDNERKSAKTEWEKDCIECINLKAINALRKVMFRVSMSKDSALYKQSDRKAISIRYIFAIFALIMEKILVPEIEPKEVDYTPVIVLMYLAGLMHPYNESKKVPTSRLDTGYELWLNISEHEAKEYKNVGLEYEYTRYDSENNKFVIVFKNKKEFTVDMDALVDYYEPIVLNDLNENADMIYVSAMSVYGHMLLIAHTEQIGPGVGIKPELFEKDGAYRGILNALVCAENSVRKWVSTGRTIKTEDIGIKSNTAMNNYRLPKCIKREKEGDGPNELSAHAKALITLGVFVSVVLLLIFIFWLIFKMRPKMPTVQMGTMGAMGYGYNQQQSMYNQPMMQQQPMYNQPMYNQPMMQSQQMYNQPVMQQPMMQQPVMQQPMMQQPVMQQPIMQTQPMYNQQPHQRPMQRPMMRQQPMQSQYIQPQPMMQPQMQQPIDNNRNGIPDNMEQPMMQQSPYQQRYY
jgi:hypothetical protein